MSFEAALTELNKVIDYEFSTESYDALAAFYDAGKQEGRDDAYDEVASNSDPSY